MTGNRYGVDTDYFKKKLNRVIRDLENYTPSELYRELSTTADAIRPIDSCLKCGKQSLVVFDEDSNECLKCQNIQNLKAT